MGGLSGSPAAEVEPQLTRRKDPLKPSLAMPIVRLRTSGTLVHQETARGILAWQTAVAMQGSQRCSLQATRVMIGVALECVQHLDSPRPSTVSRVAVHRARRGAHPGRLRAEVSACSARSLRHELPGPVACLSTSNEHELSTLELQRSH